MANYKAERFAGEIQRIIGSMLINGVKDPRIAGKMVNITGVEVTRDEGYATVYVAVLDPTEEEEILAGLRSAKGLFKKEIASQVKVRNIPELVFKPDHSLSYATHIEEVISSLGIENYKAEDSNGVVSEETK